MIEAINKKKILFFGIGFYDYEKVIKENLEKEEAIIDYINAWEKFPFYKLIVHISKNWQMKCLQKNLLKKIYSKAVEEYDFVFVIKGDVFNAEIVQVLRKSQPKAKFILYEWDSIKRNLGLLNIIKLFNSVFSFDFDDCEKYGFKYRALFAREVSVPSYEKDIDLFFLGWAHSNRIKMLNEIFQKYENSDKKIVLKILVGKIQYLKLLFNKSISKKFLKECILHNPLNYDEYLALLKRAKAVLDLCHPDQSGLTMRTIETVAMNNFLFTTNKNINKEKNIDITRYAIISGADDIDLNASRKIETKIFPEYGTEQFLSELFR
ncbi:hypothetical protein [uncultured Treponema sp.]|uniref:hypothetical protein n=1 Tax=uncultured Treponema sp. TaxID=162155 RepID=UPI0025F5FA0F|nr:hypothetical protein [uncultured Treponema sp.]